MLSPTVLELGGKVAKRGPGELQRPGGSAPYLRQGMQTQRCVSKSISASDLHGCWCWKLKL